MNFRSKWAITRNGVAPSLTPSLTASNSASSAVLLSRSTVNCATPTPRRGATPGIASRPPCGAANMIGSMPAQMVRNREGSLSAWAHACAGKYRPSAKNKIRARDFTRSTPSKDSELHTARRAARATVAAEIYRLDARGALVVLSADDHRYESCRNRRRWDDDDFIVARASSPRVFSKIPAERVRLGTRGLFSL